MAYVQYIVGQHTPTSPNIKTIDWITLTISLQYNALLGNPASWHSHGCQMMQNIHLNSLAEQARSDDSGPPTGQCHTTKTVHKQFEESVSALKVFTSHPNGPRSRSDWATWHWPVKCSVVECCSHKGIYFVCFMGILWIKNIYMITRTQGFLLQLCTVTVITVLHFICQWVYCGFYCCLLMFHDQELEM